MSQSDRLIWPPDHIQCIDEPIAVAKQRVLETSNLVRYVFHARTDIRDHRRERWRDLSIVGVVLKTRQRNHPKVDQFLVTRRTLHIEPNIRLFYYISVTLILLSIISCYVHQETNFKCKSLARYCIHLHYLRAIKLLIVYIFSIV